MNFEEIDEKIKEIYNQSVNHPLQTYEWGEFRKKTGIKIIRKAQFNNKESLNPYQISVHKTPGFPYFIGYFPKGELPSKELLDELKEMGEKEHLSFVQLEPNITINKHTKITGENLKKSFHPLFTKYSFILDLTKSDDEILSNMHQKTRYNVKLAERKGVSVEIDNSEKAFKKYLELTNETTKRQKFYAHDEKYHKLMWETIGNTKNEKFNPNRLQANILTAKYGNKILVTWVLFTFKDTLYYPYGASSSENREVMPSPLTMWKAIKWGKELGLKKFDMWGAANVKDPKPDNQYYGFHKFKEGFGAELTEFIGSYDFVINPINYRLLTMADKIRWAYLKARKN